MERKIITKKVHWCQQRLWVKVDCFLCCYLAHCAIRVTTIAHSIYSFLQLYSNAFHFSCIFYEIEELTILSPIFSLSVFFIIFFSFKKLFVCNNSCWFKWVVYFIGVFCFNIVQHNSTVFFHMFLSISTVTITFTIESHMQTDTLDDEK